MTDPDPTDVVPGLSRDDDEIDESSRRRSRWLVRGSVLNMVLGVALLVVLALIAWTIRGGDTEPTSTTQTATVDTGDVSATVSANGNIASGTTVNADFQGSGGVVTDILVKPGQKVRKGQLLARVDRTTALQALEQARISLRSAQASYSTTVEGQTPAENQRDQTSIQQAQVSVEGARVSLRQARQSLALTRRQKDGDVRRAEQDLTRAKADLQEARAAYQSDPSTENRQVISEAEASVSAAQTALAAARQGRDTALLQGRQQVTSAQQQLKSATTSLASAKASVAVNQQGPKDGELAQAQAQVDSAELGVREAQETLDQADLRAPTAGTVAAVNGTVGEPSSSSGSSASSSGSSTGTTSASSSSTTDASGFVVLTATNALQVTADVAEADITDVEVGQRATVTLSATGTEIAGTVSAVDSVETVTNNVVEYGVTVTLDTSKGVRLGQSAQVVVTTGEKQQVLRVSSSALTSIGQSTTATVEQSDGTSRTVEVTTGLEGDGYTEVLSGLNDGDTVVLPEQSDSGTGFTFPGAGGGLGGGIP